MMSVINQQTIVRGK